MMGMQNCIAKTEPRINADRHGCDGSADGNSFFANRFHNIRAEPSIPDIILPPSFCQFLSRNICVYRRSSEVLFLHLPGLQI